MKKLLLILLCGRLDGPPSPPSQRAASRVFPLTVDSIMRGPELVGNPPNNLRWSGDSKELYFEWRMPKEDQAATWVVARDGSGPRRLSDGERRIAPLPTGSGTPPPPHPRRRRGDIVVIDSVNRKRIDVTRTTGSESSPRWARGETHVTFVRDNNLFIVPVESVAAGGLVQLTDGAPGAPIRA